MQRFSPLFSTGSVWPRMIDAWRGAAAIGRRPHADAAAVLELLDEGAVLLVDGVIRAINPAMERLLPEVAACCRGKPLAAILPGWTIEAVPRGAMIEAMLPGAAGEIPVRLCKRPMRGTRAVAVLFHDQRDRLAEESRLSRLLDEDQLTGLANRRSFTARLAARCDAAGAASPDGFGVLLIDLARFCAIGQAHGEGTGNAVLSRVAARLRTLATADDLVARTDGDEFAMLVEGGGRATEIAAEVTDLLANPLLMNGQIHDTACNVGVALFPQDGCHASELTRAASLALNRAKADGRSHVRRFDPAMASRMRERHEMELALRRAIARREFQLVYQPQVDARTGGFNGAEALIRWNSRERGAVAPLDFLPLAEETGLILPIGGWVLRQACADAAAWAPHLRVAVNVSAIQLRDARFPALVASVLQETGLPGSRLELEITESVLLQEDAQTFEVLNRLRARGVRLSIDDFGTGYSSMGYLRRFRFDKIKIDQSFVRQAPDDLESMAIVRAVVALGLGLGMSLTAEGVETEPQHRFVAGLGCDQIQGYLTGRPLPLAELPTAFAAPPNAAVA